MEGAQRNRADYPLFGKMCQQPADVLENALDEGVVDVGEALGVLAALDVHQRDQLGMFGRIQHESVDRQSELLERVGERRVEQDLQMSLEPAESVVEPPPAPAPPWGRTVDRSDCG